MNAPVVITAPLTRQQLMELTDNGQKALEVVVPMALTDLMSSFIDGINDTVSERITGSPVGLTDIGYEPYASNNPEKSEVNIVVTAQWAQADEDDPY